MIETKLLIAQSEAPKGPEGLVQMFQETSGDLKRGCIQALGDLSGKDWSMASKVWKDILSGPLLIQPPDRLVYSADDTGIFADIEGVFYELRDALAMLTPDQFLELGQVIFPEKEQSPSISSMDAADSIRQYLFPLKGEGCAQKLYMQVSLSRAKRGDATAYAQYQSQIKRLWGARISIDDSYNVRVDFPELQEADAAQLDTLRKNSSDYFIDALERATIPDEKKIEILQHLDVSSESPLWGRYQKYIIKILQESPHDGIKERVTSEVFDMLEQTLDQARNHYTPGEHTRTYPSIQDGEATTSVTDRDAESIERKIDRLQNILPRLIATFSDDGHKAEHFSHFREIIEENRILLDVFSSSTLYDSDIAEGYQRILQSFKDDHYVQVFIDQIKDIYYSELVNFSRRFPRLFQLATALGKNNRIGLYREEFFQEHSDPEPGAPTMTNFRQTILAVTLNECAARKIPFGRERVIGYLQNENWDVVDNAARLIPFIEGMNDAEKAVLIQGYLLIGTMPDEREKVRILPGLWEAAAHLPEDQKVGLFKRLKLDLSQIRHNLDTQFIASIQDESVKQDAIIWWLDNYTQPDKKGFPVTTRSVDSHEIGTMFASLHDNAKFLQTVKHMLNILKQKPPFFASLVGRNHWTVDHLGAHLPLAFYQGAIEGCRGRVFESAGEFDNFLHIMMEEGDHIDPSDGTNDPDYGKFPPSLPPGLQYLISFSDHRAGQESLGYVEALGTAARSK